MHGRSMRDVECRVEYLFRSFVILEGNLVLPDFVLCKSGRKVSKRGESIERAGEGLWYSHFYLYNRERYDGEVPWERCLIIRPDQSNLS